MEVRPGKSAPRCLAQLLGKSWGPAFCVWDAQHKVETAAYINSMILAFRNDDVNGSTPKGEENTATNPLSSSGPASCPGSGKTMTSRPKPSAEGKSDTVLR